MPDTVVGFSVYFTRDSSLLRTVLKVRTTHRETRVYGSRFSRRRGRGEGLVHTVIQSSLEGGVEVGRCWDNEFRL